MTAQGILVPTFEQFRFDIELIQYASNCLIDHIVQSLGPVIEGRDGRKDDGPHAGQGDHAFEMTEMERGFSSDQHQFFSLLEDNISGSHEKIAAYGQRDSTHGFH